ncbi:hypothetical protein Goklo_002523 [Gossypium klotzschianum]|uniref:Uncharacterized protein n=1 Tax=Gossypium klotzschianum TaxID=34286 RepID=A0A7J8VUI4_9ROSI|nr:hypothetical protein [Gossypium klotzschianum]
MLANSLHRERMSVRKSGRF